MTINPLSTRPAVEIPDRPAPTKAQKTAAWNRENGLCWWCGKPVARDGLDVEWDHTIPRAISGDDSTDNLAPLHVACHSRKTNRTGGDKGTVAKTMRQSKLCAPKVRKPGGFNRNLKRKFDGTVVERSR